MRAKLRAKASNSSFTMKIFVTPNSNSSQLPAVLFINNLSIDKTVCH